MRAYALACGSADLRVFGYVGMRVHAHSTEREHTNNRQPPTANQNRCIVEAMDAAFLKKHKKKFAFLVGTQSTNRLHTCKW